MNVADRIRRLEQKVEAQQIEITALKELCMQLSRAELTMLERMQEGARLLMELQKTVFGGKE